MTEKNPPGANRVRLTKKAVQDALDKHQPGKRTRLWDVEVPELYLMITPNGSASYCLRYQRLSGVKADYTIGKARNISPDMAREAAKQQLAGLTLNKHDPVAARREAKRAASQQREWTLAPVIDEYLVQAGLRPNSLGTQRSAAKHLKRVLGNRPIEEITSKEVKSALTSIQADIAKSARQGRKFKSGHRMTNLCHTVLKAMFNWVIEDRELTIKNPANFAFLFEDEAEKRIGRLNDERLKMLWEGLTEKESDPVWRSRVLGCKLHFVTLQRPAEIIRAHQDDFDWDANVWRPNPARTKTKQAYFVPLTALSKALFQELFKLSGEEWALPKRGGGGPAGESILRDRFVELRDELVAAGRLKFDDIDLYDGRRFGRTAIRKRLKFPKDVAEMVINHKQPNTISDIYEVEDNEEEVREAQEAWTKELMRIVGET